MTTDSDFLAEIGGYIDDMRDGRISMSMAAGFIRAAVRDLDRQPSERCTETPMMIDAGF